MERASITYLKYVIELAKAGVAIVRNREGCVGHPSFCL